MAKRPFPIYSIGRFLVALYVAHLLTVFVMWARDHSLVTTEYREVTRRFETELRFKLERSGTTARVFVPVAGILDRLQWRLGVSVDNKPWEWFEIDSPNDFPFESRPGRPRMAITETRYEIIVEGANDLTLILPKNT